MGTWPHSIASESGTCISTACPGRERDLVGSGQNNTDFWKVLVSHCFVIENHID